LNPQPIAGWPASSLDARTLNSVIVHPQFAQNHFVYLSYVKANKDGMTTMAIARGRPDDAALTNVQDVFVTDAWVKGGQRSGDAQYRSSGRTSRLSHTSSVGG